MWKEFSKKPLIDKVTQIWIFIFGVLGMLLISRPESWGAWGYVAGLIAQPAWFYTTIKNKQYGIFALSFFYTFAWCQGIWFNLINSLI